jgi:hypothetical protein
MGEMRIAYYKILVKKILKRGDHLGDVSIYGS